MHLFCTFVNLRKGTSVEELRAHIKKEEFERSKQRLAAAAEAAAQASADISDPADAATAMGSKGQAPPGVAVRKDSSPVKVRCRPFVDMSAILTATLPPFKPLDSFLNLSRLLESPHTSSQISALWTAYHASRSGGTGRGFICASLPRDTYDTMLSVAQKYPAFVVPMPRVAAELSDESQKGHEFFFMQWAFHGAPPIPVKGQAGDFLFATGTWTASQPPEGAIPNSATATVLFTPLLEYKMRQTFATPYLVLTFYPDLSTSHKVVLLRGEITPAVASAASPSMGDRGEYLLGQQDAQLLAMAVQQFYLWNKGEHAKERETLLKCFHESPQDFKWEELLKHGGFGI